MKKATFSIVCLLILASCSKNKSTSDSYTCKCVNSQTGSEAGTLTYEDEAAVIKYCNNMMQSFNNSPNLNTHCEMLP